MRDFRPPSAGGEVGECYLRMIEEYRVAIDSYRARFPELAALEITAVALVVLRSTAADFAVIVATLTTLGAAIFSSSEYYCHGN